MSKLYYPVVIHYSQNASGLQSKNSNCRYVESFSYIEDNQDVAWFKNDQYCELFGVKRSQDQKNKLLAIVRLDFCGRKIRRRYKCENLLGLNSDRIGLTSESVRILFDDIQNPSSDQILVTKGNLWDIVMYYWNHPFHATRISFRIGLPSLLLGIVSIILSIC